MLAETQEVAKKLADFTLSELLQHPRVKTLMYSALAALGPIIGTALLTTWKIAKSAGYTSGINEIRNEYTRSQYEKVYAPLYYHFCDNPVMQNSVILFGRFNERAKRSWDSLKKYKFKKAITTLCDKRIVSSTEIVFGLPFPREIISGLLKQYHHICDKNIIDLYAYLSFEDYENSSEEQLNRDSFSVAELDLYNHIVKRFVTLNSKYLKP